MCGICLFFKLGGDLSALMCVFSGRLTWWPDALPGVNLQLFSLAVFFGSCVYLASAAFAVFVRLIFLYSSRVFVCFWLCVASALAVFCMETQHK